MIAGTCSRCGQSAGRRLYDVVSANFLNSDMLRGRGSALLCNDCAEMFGSKGLRMFPHGWPGGIELSPPELFGLLSAPLPKTIGVSVPVLGRKHIAPFWQGGCVVTRGSYRRRDGRELMSPIWSWRQADVWAYLAHRGIEPNPVYARLSLVGAPPDRQRVGLMIDGNALEFGRGVWLRRGWPDEWQRIAAALPRLREFS